MRNETIAAAFLRSNVLIDLKEKRREIEKYLFGMKFCRKKGREDGTPRVGIFT